MHSLLPILAFLHSLGTFAQPQEMPIEASFDCKKAASTVEKAICSNWRPAFQDKEIASAYKVLKSLATDKEFETLKKEQKAWLQKRDQCGAGSAATPEILKCLDPLMEKREKDLLALGDAYRESGIKRLAAQIKPGKAPFSKLSADGKLLLLDEATFSLYQHLDAKLLESKSEMTMIPKKSKPGDEDSSETAQNCAEYLQKTEEGKVFQYYDMCGQGDRLLDEYRECRLLRVLQRAKPGVTALSGLDQLPTDLWKHFASTVPLKYERGLLNVKNLKQSGLSYTQKTLDESGDVTTTTYEPIAVGDFQGTGAAGVIVKATVSGTSYCHQGASYPFKSTSYFAFTKAAPEAPLVEQSWFGNHTSDIGSP